MSSELTMLRFCFWHWALNGCTIILQHWQVVRWYYYVFLDYLSGVVRTTALVLRGKESSFFSFFNSLQQFMTVWNTRRHWRRWLVKCKQLCSFLQRCSWLRVPPALEGSIWAELVIGQPLWPLFRVSHLCLELPTCCNVNATCSALCSWFAGLKNQRGEAKVNNQTIYLDAGNLLMRGMAAPVFIQNYRLNVEYNIR